MKSLGFSLCLGLHPTNSWNTSGTDNPIQFWRFLKIYGKPHWFSSLSKLFRTRQDAQVWTSFKVHGTYPNSIQIFYAYRILAVSITQRSFRAPCLWVPQDECISQDQQIWHLFQIHSWNSWGLAFLSSNNTKRY